MAVGSMLPNTIFCFEFCIVAVSAVKLPDEAKQNNIPPECGQPIDGGDYVYDNCTM
jgi:hypothetical protein